MYHHCFALNLGAFSVNSSGELWGALMLCNADTTLPTSLEKAGREGAVAGGACDTRCAQEQLKIPAREWWESFLPLT